MCEDAVAAALHFNGRRRRDGGTLAGEAGVWGQWGIEVDVL